MNLLKKFSQNETIQRLLGFLISTYIKFCYQTSLWYIKNNEIIENSLVKKKKIFVFFWHNRLMMAPFCWRYKKTFKMLISGHRDGKIISSAVSHLNIQTIQGSSHNNKVSSVKQIINELNNFNIVGITPDGPRGPKEKIKDGVVSLQKKNDVIIFPLSYSSKFKFKLNSWDNFLFTFPFNKYVVVWGNPVSYNYKKSVKENIFNIQKELDRVTNLAENLSK